MALNRGDYDPALRQDVPVSQTWVSGNTKTVSDANVKATSRIFIMWTSAHAGSYHVSVSSESFTITNSEALTNATFIYEIR